MPVKVSNDYTTKEPGPLVLYVLVQKLNFANSVGGWRGERFFASRCSWLDGGNRDRCRDSSLMFSVIYSTWWWWWWWQLFESTRLDDAGGFSFVQRSRPGQLAARQSTDPSQLGIGHLLAPCRHAMASPSWQCCLRVAISACHRQSLTAIFFPRGDGSNASLCDVQQYRL
jgi:hypothetical protein